MSPAYRYKVFERGRLRGCPRKLLAQAGVLLPGCEVLSGKRKCLSKYCVLLVLRQAVAHFKGRDLADEGAQLGDGHLVDARHDHRLLVALNEQLDGFGQCERVGGGRPEHDDRLVARERVCRFDSGALADIAVEITVHIVRHLQMVCPDLPKKLHLRCVEWHLRLVRHSDGEAQRVLDDRVPYWESDLQTSFGELTLESEYSRVVGTVFATDLGSQGNRGDPPGRKAHTTHC